MFNWFYKVFKIKETDSSKLYFRVSFSTSKSEKQSRIKDLVEESLVGASSIYLFNNLQLDKDNWQSILQSQQKQLIQNVYHKRLASQLTEQVAVAVIREANNARLQQFFVGNDFAFFDNQGNLQIYQYYQVSQDDLL